MAESVLEGRAAGWDLTPFRWSRFRLDDDAVAPDGVGTDESVPLWFRTSWGANDNFRVSGLLGLSINGELELEDSGGNSINTVDADPAAFVGLFMNVRF